MGDDNGYKAEPLDPSKMYTPIYDPGNGSPQAWCEAWCEVDGCPVSICQGPHIEHACSGQGGDFVTLRADDYPCRFCGEPVTGSTGEQP